MNDALTILLFLLLIALRILVTRRLTNAVLNKDERIQWFGFNRTLGQMSIAFWIAWLGLWWLLRPWEGSLDLQMFYHRDNPAVVIALAFAMNCAVLIIPAAVGFWCDLIVYPAVQTLRNLGLTKREYVIDSAFIRLWLPMAGALIWIGFSAANWMPLAVAFVPPLGALWLILSPKIWMKLRGSEVYVPHSVTHGPLRDRVFEMAAKAGVELKQIYVYPLEKWKLANAWASQQNTLLLTDTLLNQLSRREIDAIVAHEIAHMKSKHPTKQGLLLFVLIAGGVVAFQYFMPHGRIRSFPRLETVALALLGAWQILKFVRGWFSRRHEIQADAAGLALSNDGAAFISGLAKLHRMNATPLEFKRLEEGFSTHPSTRRRFDAVAKASNISDDELRRLIADGLGESERYPLPVGIAPQPGEEGLIFTSRVKQKAVASFTAAYYLTISVPAAAFVAAMPFVSGPVFWGLLAVMLPVYAWLIVTTLDRAGHRHVWKLRERLRKKLAPNNSSEMWFVGLGPHRDVRIYEGGYVWDIGFLEIGSGEIRYVGEQVTFTVRASEIVSLKLVSGAPRWRKTKVILLEWMDAQTKQTQYFRLSCPQASFSRDAKSAEKLFQKLAAWRENFRDPVEVERGAKPIFPEITSAPQPAGKPKTFFFELIVASAAPMAFALGLDWDGRLERAGMALLLVTLAHLFATIPLRRKPRVFAEKSWSAP